MRNRKISDWSYDKSPSEMSKGQNDHTNNAKKNDYTAVADPEVTTATQLVWLTWFTATFPLTATAV